MGRELRATLAGAPPKGWVTLGEPGFGLIADRAPQTGSVDYAQFVLKPRRQREREIKPRNNALLGAPVIQNSLDNGFQVLRFTDDFRRREKALFDEVG